MKQIPHILHLFWGRSKPLSWLRWLTVNTFADLNPDWRVIVWYPKTPGRPAPWQTKEHVHCTWEGEDWFKRLSEAGANVEVRQAPIGDFPALSDVHRSDLLRWRLLHTMGGFWSDFDIIYFRPMADLQVDMTADALLCWGETEELKDWQAIGFLAGAPGCSLFKRMEEAGLVLAKMPNLAYQDLGAHLLSRFARPGNKEAAGSRVAQIPMRAVYPFSTVKSQMPALWNNHALLDVRNSTIGVHWFAAQRQSCLKESSWTGPGDVDKERRLGGARWAMQQAGVAGPYDPAGAIEYSIIMPYMDRAELLHNTLVSLAHWYGGREDWEVAIVQDSKCVHPEELLAVVEIWRRRGLDICIVVQEAAGCYNPAKLFNRGVKEARGRYVILTSPEIYHEADVLAGLDVAFEGDPDQYVVCSCRNRGRAMTQARIKKHGQLRGPLKEWVQHSTLRPARYHFCSALRKELYLQVGGFDEQFSLGFCFDDDDFRDTVVEAGITITQRDDLLTWHQWHPHCDVPDKKVLWDRNRAIYEAKHGPYRPVAMMESGDHIADIDKKVIPSEDRPGPTVATVLCVLKSGGYFTEDYVTRLRNMLERNTTVAYDFLCLTDLPGIHSWSTRDLRDDLPGWWSKIELFRPGLVATERAVYFDLDTLILGNIDGLLQLPGDFYGLRPWNTANRLSGQFGSGVMAWQVGAFDFLADDFDKGMITPHQGDQAYLSGALADKGLEYLPLQDASPGIYSFKRECRRNGGPPLDARIVCFHGRPRVHEVEDKWVMEAWR